MAEEFKGNDGILGAEVPNSTTQSTPLAANFVDYFTANTAALPTLLRTNTNLGPKTVAYQHCFRVKTTSGQSNVGTE